VKATTTEPSCGTEAAYRRHLGLREPIDSDCRRTQRELIREYQSARQRALKRLARQRHREYRDLVHAAVRTMTGPLTPQDRQRAQQSALRDLGRRHHIKYRQLLKQAQAAIEAERELASLPPQAAADRWNRDHPVGTKVWYWTGRRAGRPRRGETSSLAVVSGGRAALKVGDYPLRIALTHISIDADAQLEQDQADA
jgi:hypothetical protein